MKIVAILAALFLVGCDGGLEHLGIGGPGGGAGPGLGGSAGGPGPGGAGAGGGGGVGEGSGEEPPITTLPLVQPPGFPPLQAGVPEWRLSYGAESALVLADLTQGFVYVPGRFTGNGFDGDVELRHRGDSARYHPKLSWKVAFPDGVEVDGRSKLNLMAEWLDRSFFTDKLNYDLMAAAGVPAPAARYATLRVNGRLEGLFVEVEQVDKRFLRARGLDDDASIYRAGGNDGELDAGPKEPWQWPWEKKTNETEPWDEIYALEQLVSRTPEASFSSRVDRALQLDLYLRYLAVGMLIGYGGEDQAGNYFARDPAGSWLMIPWDLNNASDFLFRLDVPEQRPYVTRSIKQSTAYDSYLDRQLENGIRRLGPTYHNVWTTLDTRIWDRPELRARLLAYTRLYLDTIFSEEQAFARVDALWALAEPGVRADPYLEPGDADRAPQFVKDWISARRAFLQTQLEAAEHHGEGGLLIAEVSPAGGGRRDAAGHEPPFIRLENHGASPLSLEGLTITDMLRDQFRHPLPALTIPPSGSLVLFADGAPEEGSDHLPFRLDPAGGELGVNDGVHRYGVLDLHVYGPVPAGQSERRDPAGSERWVVAPVVP